MSMGARGEMSRVPAPRSLRPLRVTGLIAMLAAAPGSLGLLFVASQRRPPLLMVIFVVWLLAPFAILLLADRFSRGWSDATRTALYSMMIVVAVGSLAIYIYDAMRPRQAQAAFFYVIVPPASVLLEAIVVLSAALLSRRDSRSGYRA